MNFTPMQMAGLILIISVILMLIVFVSINKSIGKRIKRFGSFMSSSHSECYIDIEERKVIIREYRESKYSKEYSYDLEEYIYMLSINPDSKLFRELLKLVNNKATKKKIVDKLTTLENTFMFIVDYGDGRRSISYNNINSQQEVDNRIYFQMVNNELLPEIKSSIKKDFLNESIIPINDTEIYNSLSKDAKRYVSKGVTIIKISPKYGFVDSNKDFLLNTVRMFVLKNKLLTLGVKTYLSLEGSLYGVVANDRNKTNNSVQKAWTSKITSLFPKKKKRLEYVDALLEEIIITTHITQAKDSKTLNEAVIFVNVASEETFKKGFFRYKNVYDKTSDIVEWSEKIVAGLKEKKQPIKVNKNVIEERGVKAFYDVFLDFPEDKLASVIKYSFRNRKTILEALINATNKESNKYKEENVFFSIDLNSIHDIIPLLSTTKLKKNVYLSLMEEEQINHASFMLSRASETLKELKVKTIQFVDDETGLMIDLYRIFRPELVMLNKGINDSTVLSDQFKLNLNNIINIKDKETKIINIK